MVLEVRRVLPQRARYVPIRSSHCGAAETNLTSMHEDTGSIPGLAQWVKDLVVPVSCGVGCRCSLEPRLLWLWWRLAAAALIRSLAWELTYAALKRQKKKNKNEVPNPVRGERGALGVRGGQVPIYILASSA